MPQRPPFAVQRFLQALGPLPPPRRHPALVLISGLPGTGKSQFARELQGRTGAAVLESDALRRLLAQKPSYSWQESRRLFAAIHAVAERLLCEGIPVILDATNLAEAHRRPLYAIAEKSQVRLLLVEVTAPVDVARARLAERAAAGESSSEADVTIYERMLPTRETIRREHLVVDTSKPHDRALSAIAREMERGESGK
jgi:predicted kinase